MPLKKKKKKRRARFASFAQYLEMPRMQISRGEAAFRRRRRRRDPQPECLSISVRLFGVGIA